MNLMTLLMQKDSNFLRLLKKDSGRLPELDMGLIDELSDAYMSGDVTPITQLAFAIISELADSYDEGQADAMSDVENTQQKVFLMMHPGHGNS